MGTIINTLYLAQENHLPVDWLIAEGLVYSPQAIVERFWQTDNRQLKLPSDIKLDEIYRQQKMPFLLFFGSDDFVFSTKDLELFRKDVKNLTVVNYEGKHLVGLFVLKDKYIEAIKTFLNTQGE